MELKLTLPLVLCDDPDTRAQIQMALEPVVKNLTITKSSDEAYNRAARQAFHFYVLRTKVPHIGNANSFFHWCKGQKTHASAPWFVLGSDIEKAEDLKKFPQIQVIDDPSDLVRLLQILKEMFPNPKEAATKAQASSSVTTATLSSLDIKPLLTSIVATLKAALGQDLKRGETSIQREVEELPVIAPSAGSILVATEKMRGSMALHFSPSAFTKIQERVLGKAAGIAGKKELMAKLATMLGENAKDEFRASGHKSFVLEPDPECIRYREDLQNALPVYVRVPFSTSYGDITVECLVGPK